MAKYLSSGSRSGGGGKAAGNLAEIPGEVRKGCTDKAAGVAN
jgi:hypothetical protein